MYCTHTHTHTQINYTEEELKRAVKLATMSQLSMSSSQEPTHYRPTSSNTSPSFLPLVLFFLFIPCFCSFCSFILYTCVYYTCITHVHVLYISSSVSIFTSSLLSFPPSLPSSFPPSHSPSLLLPLFPPSLPPLSFPPSPPAPAKVSTGGKFSEPILPLLQPPPPGRQAVKKMLSIGDRAEGVDLDLLDPLVSTDRHARSRSEERSGTWGRGGEGGRRGKGGGGEGVRGREGEGVRYTDKG